MNAHSFYHKYLLNLRSDVRFTKISNKLNEMNNKNEKKTSRKKKCNKFFSREMLTYTKYNLKWNKNEEE